MTLHIGWPCHMTCTPQVLDGDVLERPCTVGGGGVSPPPQTPPPPPLPMFGADRQNFASAPSVPRGFTLQTFGPPSAGALGGPWEEGGPSQNPLPSPSDPPFQYTPGLPPPDPQASPDPGGDGPRPRCSPTALDGPAAPSPTPGRRRAVGRGRAAPCPNIHPGCPPPPPPGSRPPQRGAGPCEVQAP